MTDKKNIVSTKGICLKGKTILLKQDRDGTQEWALPGGKIELGETPMETVKRELKEELGKNCKLLDKRPIGVYSFQFKGDEDLEQITCICYLVNFSDYNFTPQEEQLQTKFFNFSEIADLHMNPGHKSGLLEILQILTNQPL